MIAPALSLHSITKRFGAVTALDGASLSVARGTVHALLGENGAGKTTLMRIAYGLERPDDGVMHLNGEPLLFRAPADAIARGVGMVQQHFSLIPAMTASENVALGRHGRFHPRAAADHLRMLAKETGLEVMPEVRAGDLSVGAQQKLELLKVFSRNAQTLILDEPTAVLAPSEARELMMLIRRVADGGGAIVLVTHKLREALSIADEVTVLRRGRTVLTASASTVSEVELARAMFPEGLISEASAAVRPKSEHGRVIAELRDVELRDRQGVARVRNATLVVHTAEIVGVAGVEGSGYHQLLLALGGRLAPAVGDVTLPSEIAFIPEHRQRDGLIPDFSVTENIALRDIARVRGRLPWSVLAERARVLVERHAIRASSVAAPVRTLSGGNQQKLVLARELQRAPPLVVAMNPTQGLDVRATTAIHAQLRNARDEGAGVVVYTSDLDELLALADKVVVAFEGSIREVTRDADTIGRAMLGALT